MIAILHGRNEVRISGDVARALAGFKGGYRVVLHGLAGFVFDVDANTVDDAHRIALECVRREKVLKNTGATVQAR